MSDVSDKYSRARALLYVRRALRLRCPECGVSPIFVPARKVRTVRDWFVPLCGCPRCGYAYEREDGYFLLAIWGVNYGFVGGLGLAVGLLLQYFFAFTAVQVLAFVLVPMAILSLAFARHAKSLFLAFDHYFDPHVAAR
jgi:uncharacterized protein (DUF983 family)